MRAGVSQVLGTMLAAFLILSLIYMYCGVLLKSHVVYQELHESLELEHDRKLEDIMTTLTDNGSLEIVNAGNLPASLRYVILKNESSMQVLTPESVGLFRKFKKQPLPMILRNYLSSPYDGDVLLLTERGNIFKLNDPITTKLNVISTEMSAMNVSITNLYEEINKLKISLSNSTTVNVSAGDVLIYHPFFGLMISDELPASEWASTTHNFNLGSKWNCTEHVIHKTGTRGLVEGSITIYGYKLAYSSDGYNFGILYVNKPNVYRSQAYGGCIRAEPYCQGSTGYPASGGAYMDLHLEQGKYKMVANYYLYNGYHPSHPELGSSSAGCSLSFANNLVSDSVGSGNDPYEKYTTLFIEDEVPQGEYRVDVKLWTGYGWLSGYWVLPLSHLLSVSIYRLGECTLHDLKFYGVNGSTVTISFTYNLKTGELNVQGNTLYLDNLKIVGYNSVLSYTIKQPNKVRLYAPAGTQVFLDGSYVCNVSSIYVDIECSPGQQHELRVIPPNAND